MPDAPTGGSTVTVPKVGKVKKAYVWGAVALVGGYVAWKWYGARGEGEVEYTTDYVSEPIATGGGGGAAPSGYTPSTPVDNTGLEVISTNAQWSAKAVGVLANAGYDPAAVYAALGDFLARAPLTAGEATIVRAALAAAGNPPVGGPYTITVQAGEVTLKAPTGLKATSVTGTSVTLTYTPVAGASSYTAYRGDLGGVAAGSGFGSSITVGGLTPNKTYTFTVAARTTTGKAGPKSSPVTVKTTGAKLTAPTGVKVKSQRTDAYVSWNPVAGAGGYALQLSGRGGTWESTDTTDRVTGLKPNSSYKVRVAALQPGTRTPGPWSAWASGKTSK